MLLLVQKLDGLVDLISTWIVLPVVFIYEIYKKLHKSKYITSLLITVETQDLYYTMKVAIKSSAQFTNCFVLAINFRKWNRLKLFQMLCIMARFIVKDALVSKICASVLMSTSRFSPVNQFLLICITDLANIFRSDSTFSWILVNIR